MAESLGLLFQGFATALQPTNLLFAVIGCVLGTLVGLLPGIGPVAGTAMLIPLTFTIPPTAAIIMLAAIYYGAMYGGSMTSILVNVPGEAASAITCLDGYEMAKRGRAGPALAVAAVGSFVGGTAATFGLVLLALPLTEVALRFGPPEFFSLMVVGLSLVTGLASRSLVRALLSAVLGLLLAMVGIDPVMGAPRFTFGLLALQDGLQLVPVAMGLFGIGEILVNAERAGRSVFTAPVASLVPSARDLRDAWRPILRGTGIGFFIGLIPGVGAVVPTMVSYVTEKRLSREPARFGTGMIQGVAGPESANNAYANAALIPLFTLGIPGSPTVAVIMGAFTMNGLIPGPFLFRDHADLAWGVIASLYLGNLILVILNLPFIPLWVAVLRVPYPILYTAILAFCVLGAYTLNGRAFDVGVMTVFGVVGYLMRKLDVPAAPLVLTMVLGPLMERALRQSLDISGGEFGIFVTRPISAAALAVAALLVATSLLQVAGRVKGETQV
jgi:putative tricarboxylic transport membrane protein